MASPCFDHTSPTQTDDVTSQKDHCRKRICDNVLLKCAEMKFLKSIILHIQSAATRFYKTRKITVHYMYYID